jgi:hypothetical protein
VNRKHREIKLRGAQARAARLDRRGEGVAEKRQAEKQARRDKRRRDREARR